MTKLTRYCFYVLAVFLPVQTLIAQFMANKLGISEYFNFWKEILVVVISISLFYEGARKIFEILRKNIDQSNLDSQEIKAVSAEVLKGGRNLKIIEILKITLPLLLVIALTVIILFNSFILSQTKIYVFVLGFRFELFWLWFFAIVASFLNLKNSEPGLLELSQKNTEVKISKHNFEKFKQGLLNSVLVGFILVSIISIASLGLGQVRVLEFFGFGVETKENSLISTAPSCHVIDFGQNDCRLSGTFSTPNHFAGYLLLILPVLIAGFLQARKLRKQKENLFYLVLMIFNLSFIILSFARFALLGLIVFLSIGVIFHLHKKYLKQALSKVLVVVSFLVPIFIGLVAINLDPEISSKYLPAAIAKPSSTIEHYRRSTASLEILKTDPARLITGFGLASSGPAAKPNYVDVYQNPIFKNYQPIAYQKGLVGEDLLIPENWYLQLVLNGGLVYACLYIWLVFYTLKDLKTSLIGKFKGDIASQISLYYIIGFFGIIVGNLFLHLWENQTIALYWTIVWVLWDLQKSFVVRD